MLSENLARIRKEKGLTQQGLPKGVPAPYHGDSMTLPNHTGKHFPTIAPFFGVTDQNSFPIFEKSGQDLLQAVRILLGKYQFF